MRSEHSLDVLSCKSRSALLFVLALCIGACGDKAVPSAEQLEPSAETSVGTQLTHPVTVSGVSAGAYMAVQVHVALSDQISGIGVVAGGPYHCADGSVLNALGRCMSGESLDTKPLSSFARENAASGEVADISNLKAAKVWIFHSPKDVVVSSKVANSLVEFYGDFTSLDRIKLVDDVDTAHGWPTIDAGNECLQLGGDFLNACGFDTAGELLNHVYDDLAPRNPELDKNIRDIDLSVYFGSKSGVSGAGYIFVPDKCGESNSGCRLHISFHGCRQGSEFVDDRFARNSGLNEWASPNQIVVVYPQIESSPTNPQGCWDWWGYSGENYDLRGGEQIAGIEAMINAYATRQLFDRIATSNDQ